MNQLLASQKILSRRRFLHQSLFAGLTCTLFGIPLARSNAQTTSASAGSAINVKSKGAVGDGRRDDTVAIQAAIDALPVSGGTVHIPSGRYLVDTSHPIRLRSNMHLELASDAILAAKPSSAKRFYIVLIENVSNVEISGGNIIGERDQHLGSGGEWGYGIFVRGSSFVHIHDMHVSKCWGDGICIGALLAKDVAPKYSTDVTLTRVVCSGNRRQGLTIGPARRVRVLDSEFNDTGGTAPASGIDIEPDKPETADDIQIDNCIMRNNQGCGIQIYHNVSLVTLNKCTIENNGAYGVLMEGVRQSVMTANTVSGNGLTGAMVRGGATDCQVRNNVFANNATKTVRSLLNNLRSVSSKNLNTSSVRNVQVMDDSRSITVSGNTFSD